MSRKDKEKKGVNTTADEMPENAAAQEQNAEQSPAEPEKQAAGGDDTSYTLTREEFETVQKHIAALQKEKDEVVGLLQRNQADFDNFRRRNSTIRQDSYDEGRRDCVKALLPVLDDFERVIENSGGVDGKWLDGVKLVQRKLCEQLEKMGVEVISTEEGFDPQYHNAIMTEKVEGVEGGKVLTVFQKGYRMGEKILRYSLVKVSE